MIATVPVSMYDFPAWCDDATNDSTSNGRNHSIKAFAFGL